MPVPSEQATDTTRTSDDAEDLQLLAEQTTRQMRDALRAHGWLAVDKTGPRPRQAAPLRFWVQPRTSVLWRVLIGLERLREEDSQ